MVVLCGGPDLAVDGRRLRVGAPKRSQAALALTYLLLEHGRPLPADEVAEAVWPAGPPASWPAGLRRVISDVRGWLRAGGLEVDIRAVHGTYELVLPGDAAADVAAARTSLQAARAADAAEDRAGQSTHAGRAVELLSAPLVPAYEAPWLQQHRQDLERDLLAALDLLADAERSLGNVDAAVQAAEAAIARDPLRESAYRLAMAAHRQAGRIGAALRTYEVCRRTLAEEVGSAPSPATTTAYHVLLDLQVDRSRAADPLGDLDDPREAVAAAAGLMQRLEDRQTIAALEARLATIDASPAPDPVRRVETLIELGRAHWVVEGGTEALRRISLAAGEAAVSLGLADQFAETRRLASTTTGIGQADPDAADLCRRGRDAFPRHPGVQVQILALEAELVDGLASIDLAEAAVARARATGDERLLLDALLVLDQSLAWVPDLPRRLAVQAECNELLRRVPPSFRRRPTFEVMARIEGADVVWLDELADRHPPDRAATTSWELRIFRDAMGGVEALITGDLERADRAATWLLQASAAELNATHAAGGMLLAIARERGGIEELLPAIEGIVASNPRIAAFRAALGTARAMVGDAAGARLIVDAQAASGFDDVPHEHVYLLYLGLMAEAVALLDLPQHVAPMLELLEPYEGHICVGAHGHVVLNAMDTYRGMLATVTGDPRGTAWLAAGMEAEGRIRAVLLRARSAAWLSAWLRRHGTAEDAPEAERLLAEARGVAKAEPDRQGLLAMVEHLAELR
jgi:DNA-binding SARP family transcriptional activator